MLNIFIDWGGTIARDHVTYEYISSKSGSRAHEWQGPNSWDSIRCVGNENFFEKEQHRFFRLTRYYSNSIKTISDFCGDEAYPETKTFIVYDNRPKINAPPNDIIRELAYSFNEANGSANGIYIEPDKIALIKRHGGGIMIEDDPRIAISLALADIPVVLLLRKWNHLFDIDSLKMTLPPDKFIKVRKNIHITEGWSDVKDAIKNITSGEE